MIHSDAEKFERIVQLLRTQNCSAAEELLNQCSTSIPQNVFEAALEHNVDFVFNHIHRSTVSTRNNILDRVIFDLNVPLTQHVIACLPQNSFPFLAATVRVYKKDDAQPMLNVLSGYLSPTEKIILAKGLTESVHPIKLPPAEIQMRVNCLTQGVEQRRLLSTIAHSSLPRTKEAFTAAMDYHQNQRISAHMSTPDVQRPRKI